VGPSYNSFICPFFPLPSFPPFPPSRMSGRLVGNRSGFVRYTSPPSFPPFPSFPFVGLKRLRAKVGTRTVVNGFFFTFPPPRPPSSLGHEIAVNAEAGGKYGSTGKNAACPFLGPPPLPSLPFFPPSPPLEDQKKKNGARKVPSFFFFLLFFLSLSSPFTEEEKRGSNGHGTCTGLRGTRPLSTFPFLPFPPFLSPFLLSVCGKTDTYGFERGLGKTGPSTGTPLPFPSLFPPPPFPTRDKGRAGNEWRYIDAVRRRLRGLDVHFLFSPPFSPTGK